MSTVRFVRIVAALAVAAATAGVSASSMRASSKDSIDDVVKAGQQGGLELDRLLNAVTAKLASATAASKPQLEAQVAAIRKAQGLAGRLGRDRTFAKQVLDLSLKGDKSGLGTAWTGELGPGVEIRTIRDWSVLAYYTVNGYTWEVCISSDASCGGKYATHEMIGKAR